MKFELTREEHELLLLALGLAAGTAMMNSSILAARILRLTNTIQKDRPASEWQPLKVNE